METDEDLNHFVAGLVSGEGSFFITARRTISRRRTALNVVCGFSVKLRGDDRELLELIRQALGLASPIHDVKASRDAASDEGSVQCKSAVLLIVRKLSDLTACVIPFFDRYPLRGRKRENYELWRRVVLMIERGEHLTPAGADSILEIKAQMNRY